MAAQYSVMINEIQITDSMFIRAGNHSIVTIQYAQREMIGMLLGIHENTQ